MAARYKARSVFGRWNTGIVGSYPARGMDVRGCIQKFQDWVDNEIYAYNKKHS